MRFTILTLFPKAFDSYLNESILKRARKSRKIIIDIVDIRKFTSDKHYTADGRPFGGGPGMVMKAEPILKAIEKVKRSGFKTKIILTVSRLEKEKNIERILNIFRDVLVKNNNTVLIVVGDGSLRSSLKKKVSLMGLEKNVFFEGWQDDLISYCKTADIYLSASNYEGYGLSMVEASVSGLPVVTTNVGVAGDVLMDGVNALICPVADEKCLSNSLHKLLTDEVLYNKFKENTSNISSNLIPRVKYQYLEDYRKTLL